MDRPSPDHQGAASSAKSLVRRFGTPPEASTTNKSRWPSIFLLSRIAYHEGSEKQAESYLRRALDFWRESVGPEDPHYASGLACLAFVLSRRRPDEAERLFREAIDRLQAGTNSQPSHLGAAIMLYSEHLKSHGRKKEGQSFEQRARLILDAGLTGAAPYTVDVMELRD
jgi:hypothetical protein